MRSPQDPFHVLITGGSSGIGAEVARLAAGSGARVAVMSRSLETATQVISKLPGGPAVHVPIGADVTDEEAVRDACTKLEVSFGRIELLVNSAGICEPAPLEKISGELWRRTIDTNVTGCFNVVRATLPLLRAAAEATIVNVGSEASNMGMANYVHYCTSKAALLGFTKALAVELAPAVRVNLICPGPVDTPMLRAELALNTDPAAAWDAEVARVRLHRVATAEEVAEAVLWLGRDVQYATGAVIPLDGGTTL